MERSDPPRPAAADRAAVKSEPAEPAADGDSASLSGGAPERNTVFDQVVEPFGESEPDAQERAHFEDLERETTQPVRRYYAPYPLPQEPPAERGWEDVLGAALAPTEPETSRPQEQPQDVPQPQDEALNTAPVEDSLPESGPAEAVYAEQPLDPYPEPEVTEPEPPVAVPPQPVAPEAGERRTSYFTGEPRPFAVPPPSGRRVRAIPAADPPPAAQEPQAAEPVPSEPVAEEPATPEPPVATPAPVEEPYVPYAPPATGPSNSQTVYYRPFRPAVPHEPRRAPEPQSEPERSAPEPEPDQSYLEPAPPPEPAPLEPEPPLPTEPEADLEPVPEPVPEPEPAQEPVRSEAQEAPPPAPQGAPPPPPQAARPLSPPRLPAPSLPMTLRHDVAAAWAPPASSTSTAYAPAARPAPVEAPARRDLGSLFRRGVRLAVLVFCGWFVGVLILIAAYRFINPPVSMLMALQWLSGTAVEKQWVPIERISPNLVRTVIASEDGRFCQHWGVDFVEAAKAIERATDGFPRGASTITMQVAKNLFLVPTKSYIRKAVEIPLTFAIELAWPKRRILEVYLNIVEWGPGIFGAEAAAQAHFGRSAMNLSARQAAQLAVVLPNPIARDAGSPGPRTSQRASVILSRAARSREEAACILGQR